MSTTLWEGYLMDIKNAIIEVVSAYTGVDPENTADNVWTACLDLMTQKFYDLSIAEIKEAYRLVGCGTLDVDIAAYRGIASAVAFGNTIAAYKEHRNKYLAALDYEKRKAEQAQIDKEQAEDEQRKKEYEKTVVDWYNKHRKSQGESLFLKDIPWYFFDTLRTMKIIAPTEQDFHIYQSKASKVYAEGLKEKIDRTHTENALLANYKPGDMSDFISLMNNNTKSIVTNIAKRLYLFKKIKGFDFK